MSQTSDLERDDNLADDDTLMARCQQDESAFAEIDRRFRDDLQRVVEKSLPKIFRADAEDIVQHTFVDLFRYQDWHPGTRLRTLLYRIAERNVNDFLRAQQADKRDHHRTLRLDATCRSGRGKALADEQNAGFEGGSEGYTDPKASQKEAAKQAEQLLRELMPALPLHEATALDLVWLKGHTEEAAARLMNKPVSTLKWWIKSGKERLKQLGGG